MTRAGPDTFNSIRVNMRPGNPMGIAPGSYEVLLSGWRIPTDSEFITDKDVGLVVKCSGFNPTPGASQMPNDAEYGRHQVSQRQPWILNFPIKHKDSWGG